MNLPLASPKPLLRAPAPRARLGDILVAQGLLSASDLITALALQTRQNVALGDILHARGLITEEQLLTALARQHQLDTILLAATPIDLSLLEGLDPSDCLRLGFLPCRREQGRAVIATAHPDRISQIRLKLPAALSDARYVLAGKADLQRAIEIHLGGRLAQAAELRTPTEDSCRGWSTGVATVMMAALVAAIVACMAFAPAPLIYTLFGAASLALFANTALKAACIVMAFRKPGTESAANPTGKLPKISILVPLFKERDIAGALVTRLRRLTYPRELLEVCLVVEATDTVTATALTKGGLPGWMRVVTVPEGGVQTKPRALNYALDFTSGSLIGVYDAEDAPAPDQLHRVAARFAGSDDRLACLQGVLSFYNARTNWLSRCFFFEYAGWFRVMLPGLQRLGFAIPLGGTTLFFRRDVLVRLGAWDAHNVTEDADLGMRLARRGYRCEMIDTVTQEEANSRVWPWIKQRSRWLKGYAVTWCVHMRRPARLWRELGAWRFMGFQILFLATLASFFLAPVLWWSLATYVFGWPNPIFDPLQAPVASALGAGFVAAEMVTLAVFMIAARRAGPRPSVAWVLSLPAYFIFATIAAYKGLIELLFDPFYWDKTEHGMFGGSEAGSLAVNGARVDLQPGLERDREVVAQRV
ncbi:cellulose synthase/poly-beta-1,6-N-acetylglucosamine synthase-like glycosyltransferase [Litoreibacter ponti]|uniref:Cellulose synthase/poly-beta-1,6-N-acetylglucosamine synthase-like glycosyltransferase n=1 Tax=Litoreibacter ponti TaxID=1510457 RepID=A0A2T6BJW6_9RHOB|nr:glycosyltransferase [Litoreibacter ponti]PTX56359.1 cellulose synthase/poly-beta-1,6-N-acetylglucosamine synthase-like glycosyltransferase [Litoreibacter ponti]